MYFSKQRFVIILSFTLNVILILKPVRQLEDDPLLATETRLWTQFVGFLRSNGFVFKEDAIDEEILEIRQNLVPIYVITPTYPNPLQMVHLLRMAMVLSRIQNLTWIISEDAKEKSSKGDCLTEAILSIFSS